MKKILQNFGSFLAILFVIHYLQFGSETGRIS